MSDLSKTKTTQIVDHILFCPRFLVFGTNCQSSNFLDLALNQGLASAGLSVSFASPFDLSSLTSSCTALCQVAQLYRMTPGVDPPFFSPVFSKTACFPWVFDGFLKRRIPGKNGKRTPRMTDVQIEEFHFLKTVLWFFPLRHGALREDVRKPNCRLDRSLLLSLNIWQCGSKPMVPFWGRCTTHFSLS